jgi:hypothetical protein
MSRVRQWWQVAAQTCGDNGDEVSVGGQGDTMRGANDKIYPLILIYRLILDKDI